MKWTKDTIDFLINNYNTKSNSELCNILNITRQQLMYKFRWLLNHGYISKENYDKRLARHSATDEFYNILINKMSKELAYFIGFFWADGHCNGSTMTIEIAKEDAEDIKDLFLSIYPFKITSRNRVGRKPQMTFSVCDKKASLLFQSLGKYPKSSESHKKILEFIPKEMQKYFLLGLSDGDGSFYINGNTKQFIICSNFEQDWSALLDLLVDYNFKVSKNKTIRGNYSIIRLTDSNQLKRLINWMYTDNYFGLCRKRKIIEKL